MRRPPLCASKGLLLAVGILLVAALPLIAPTSRPGPASPFAVASETVQPQYTFLDDEGNSLDPCTPTASPSWVSSYGIPCAASFPYIVPTRATHNGDNFYVMPENSGFSMYANLTINVTDILTVAVYMSTNFSDAGTNQAGMRLTHFNGFSDIVVFSMFFRNEAYGNGSFNCGDTSYSEPMPYGQNGTWAVTLVRSVSQLTCYVHAGTTISYQGVGSACGGLLSNCNLNGIDKAHLDDDSGSDDIWVSYVSIRSGLTYAKPPTCQDYGYCGDPFAYPVTLNATGIAYTFATLNGEVTSIPSREAGVTVWFQIGTNLTFLGATSNYSTWFNSSTRFLSQPLSFSMQIFGLAQNTTYYFRVVAVTATYHYLSTGASLSFRTLARGDVSGTGIASNAISAFWIVLFFVVLGLIVAAAWIVHSRYL